MKEKQEKWLQRIPAPLLAWYKTHKRTLQWRENPTPYHVWVSEIMLQQTRVEAVKEYYTRFIRALPTVQDLAVCEEEKLLKLWEGLGYYNRVRNMQKAARIIAFDYQGVFPNTVEGLKALPGIGDYTAGAIASIAFGKQAAAVDGNVLRVTARFLQDQTPVSNIQRRKELERLLSAVYPQQPHDCSAFTQSLFELGALICKPQNPDCENCPLQDICLSNKYGTQKQYPVMPEKKAKREEDVYVFIIQTPYGFCIQRRESGVLKGMNAFPSFVSNGEPPEQMLNEWGMYAFTEIKRRNFTHIFTHIIWHITCIWIQTDDAPFDTYTQEEIEQQLSLPTAFKQCMQILK